MDKIISISDNFPSHPRLEKISEYYCNRGKIYYISWNRNGLEETKENSYVFNSNTNYGNKLKKIIDIPRYTIFIRNIIKEVRPQIIICRHWQMFFIVSLLNRKNAKLIYDVCDMPSKKIVKFIENRLLKNAHTVVLSSRYFKEFYNHNNINILENRIRRENIDITQGDNEENICESGILRVTFLGKIRYFEIMRNFVDSLRILNGVIVSFYGDGPDSRRLSEYCKENEISNVEFHGRYNQEEIPIIYRKSDLIWCAYPANYFNVKYAISNKYFETLAYKTPGIFSSGTKIADEIKNKNIGFVINPYNINEIIELLDSVRKDTLILNSIKENIEKVDEPVYWDEYTR